MLLCGLLGQPAGAAVVQEPRLKGVHTSLLPPQQVKALTVLLPELPPAAVLGAPGGPLRLPPVGHVLDMLGVRLKPSGRPAGGAAGGMAFQVVDSGSSLSMSSNATKVRCAQGRACWQAAWLCDEWQ